MIYSVRYKSKTIKLFTNKINEKKNKICFSMFLFRWYSENSPETESWRDTRLYQIKAPQSVLVLLDIKSLAMCAKLKTVGASVSMLFIFQLEIIPVRHRRLMASVYVCVKIDDSRNICAGQYLYTPFSVGNDSVACS